MEKLSGLSGACKISHTTILIVSGSWSNALGQLSFYFIMKVNSYIVGLRWEHDPHSYIKIVATQYDDELNPNSWKIAYGNDCISKSEKDWIWESLPSVRDDDYLKDTRFKTAELAFEFFKTHFSDNVFPKADGT